MTPRPLLAGAALACALSWSAAAATLTTNFAAWASNAGAYATTSSTGLALYSIVTAIPLAGGGSVGTDGDTVLAPLSGWGPWSGGYGGDIFDTAGPSETLTFGPGLTALGLDLSPDLPLQGPYSETFTVTLSDGTSAAISGAYAPGTTQFVGYIGAGIDSLTIATASAPDFAFGDIRSTAVASVPEPGSSALLATALAVLGMLAASARRSATC